ncbi:ATP-binding protein [Trinickia mobilis]|uniref:ATP-binding protein n=1 Tax=Trinickia mobilis TaxID=2816356 RepID=UPI001A8DA7A1|nr:ATP-binding protein [Trinickia mobilis]
MNVLEQRAPLTQAYQTLESSRDSGFDLSAAIGEPVDNSWEAGGVVIRIKAIESDSDRSITDIAIADNGAGISPEIFPNVLSVGYSSRYNSRKGLGRFGMGLKLAALSQGRRAEVYSRARGGEQVYKTALDLDDVKNGVQEDLAIEEVEGWPDKFVDLMVNPKDDVPFDQGTLVIIRKIDRLPRGGRYGASTDERMHDLTRFLARAYRKFIDKGLRIELEGKPVNLHDPLFLLQNPRVVQKFGVDLRATIVDQGTFLIDGHSVHWIVTLLPEKLRRVRGAGGRATKGREEFADLYIPDNASKISILRNEREIYYDLVPRLLPGGKDKVDRYIGVEISFPAELDEYFQVRNVKRGAEPVSKLREELKNAIKKPVEEARREIRRFWGEVLREESLANGDGHLAAHGAVDGFDRTAPHGQAGYTGNGDNGVEGAFDNLFHDLKLDRNKPEDAAKAKWIRESFNQRALTVIDAGWPGKELFEIVHLTGKAIVKVNSRHPFFAEIVTPLKAMSEAEPEELDTQEVSELLKKLSSAIDLLILGYAKAENMHTDPEEAYGELRSHWGLFTYGLIREYLRNA